MDSSGAYRASKMGICRYGMGRPVTSRGGRVASCIGVFCPLLMALWSPLKCGEWTPRVRIGHRRWAYGMGRPVTSRGGRVASCMDMDLTDEQRKRSLSRRPSVSETHVSHPPPCPPPQPVSLGGILPPCARDPFLPLSGNVLAMGAEDGGEPGRLEQRQPVGGEAHLRVMALW